MSTIQRIVKNIATLTVSHIVTKGLGIAFSIMLARILGDEEFGKYKFATAFTALFCVVIELGYNTLLIRDVARDKTQAEKYYHNVMAIRIVLSVIVLATMFVTINVMDRPNDTIQLVYFLGLSSVLTLLATVCRMLFRAFEKMEYEMYTVVSYEILRNGVCISLLLAGFGLKEIMYAFLGSAVFDLLLSLFMCTKKFVKPRLSFDWSFWKQTIWAAIAFSLPSIFGMIYTQIDTVMLESMKGDAVVGWYSVAYSLILAFKFIPGLIMNAILPLMSVYSVSSIESLKLTYQKVLKFMVMAGLPLAVGLTMIAEKIIVLLYDQQYGESISALQILAWDAFLFFMVGPLGNVLSATNKQNLMAAVAGAGAVLNVILNLTWIPSLSYIGASIATVITETVIVGIFMYIVSKQLKTFFLHRIILKPLLASVVMGVFIFFSRNMNIFAEVAIAVLVYFVVLFLLKGFSEDEIDMLKRLLLKLGIGCHQ